MLPEQNFSSLNGWLRIYLVISNLCEKIGMWRKNFGLKIAYSLFFAGILLIATYIRLQHLPRLEGKYLLGTDAYRFLRQAEYISEHGRLPKRDMMRWLPIGRDLTRQLSLSSYMIAYLYKFCRLFYPSITVYQTAVYYPLLLYLAILLVIYLLVQRLMNRDTALLAVAILAISPSTLPRSMAGFADRDGLCLLLALSSFYCYIRGIQTENLPKKLIWHGFSGIAMMLLGLTWEGVGLFISVIVLCHITKLVLNDYTVREFFAYICWVSPIMLGLLILTRTYWGGANYSSPFAFAALSMPLFLLFVAACYLGIQRFPSIVTKLTFNQRLPLGSCIIIGLTILMSLIVFSLAFLSESVSSFFTTIKNNFLSPLGQSRLMQTVGELSDSSIISWKQNFQAFFLCFSAGVLLSLYQLCKKLQFNPWIIMTSFELILITVFYNRVPPGFFFNVSDPKSISYFGSLFVFVFLALFIYFYTYWKHSFSHEEFQFKVDSGTTLLFFWFLLTLFVSRGAIRYIFFFTPIAAIYGAFALVKLYQWIFKNTNTEMLFISMLCIILCWESYVFFNLAKNLILIGCIAITTICVSIGIYIIIKNRYLAYALRIVNWVTLFAFLICLTSLFPPIGGYARVSSLIAKGSRPYVSPSWKKALEWMKDNLPRYAVVAAYWDYGSHINVLANRATIIDEDHYIPYWIYLFYRHVLYAQTEIEALQFLKTHGATHLIIDDDCIRRSNMHSYVGSDETLDRYIVPVVLLQVSQKDNPLNIHFVPMSQPNIDIEIEGRTYAPHEWELKQIILKLESTSYNDTEGPKIKEANAVVLVEEKEFDLPLKKLFFPKREIIIESGSFPGGLIVSQIENEQKEDVKIWKALYLPEIGYNALAVKLYLRGIETPHFKLIYSSSNQENHPINSLPYGVKIWEIIYPPDLEPTPAYLETEFKSKELYRSWMLGESTVK